MTTIGFMNMARLSSSDSCCLDFIYTMPCHRAQHTPLFRHGALEHVSRLTFQRGD